MPESCSKFIAAFGVMTVFDPYIVFAVDVLTGNFACYRYAACQDDLSRSGTYLLLYFPLYLTTGLITVPIRLSMLRRRFHQTLGSHGAG